jgi:tetratricopeptide (TPR) repeat protein
MDFEQALKQGDLDVARAILDELVELPDTGGLLMPECYADLAREYDRQGRDDDAIALHERAIELGWDSIPHPRSDIAEFHLRAGREDEAAAIWAELKAADPEDVWLYNAAGLSYNEVGEHELAIAWLGEGIELAMRTDDPEGIINQLSDVRRQSLTAVGRDLDELEERVGPFMKQWRSEAQQRRRRLARTTELANSVPVIRDPPRLDDRDDEEIVVSLAWFPSGEYEQAIRRWPSLAEGWADVPHDDYCARLDGNIKWMRSHGVPIRAVAPIVVEDYVAWCVEHDEDPEEARAAYAAHLTSDGDVIPWPGEPKRSRSLRSRFIRSPWEICTAPTVWRNSKRRSYSGFTWTLPHNMARSLRSLRTWCRSSGPTSTRSGVERRGTSDSRRSMRIPSLRQDSGSSFKAMNPPWSYGNRSTRRPPSCPGKPKQRSRTSRSRTSRVWSRRTPTASTSTSTGRLPRRHRASPSNSDPRSR